jgi:hypothetical protein
MKSEIKQIPVYKIYYSSQVEKVHSKTHNKVSLIKRVPTEKGVKEILNSIKKMLKKNKISFDNSFFRIFNHDRVDQLLLYGSDRANQLEKRKFDKTEWEVYPFRLIMDYYFTDKKGRLLDKKGGNLIENSLVKSGKEFFEGGGIRPDVYAGIPDKDVLKYYNKILKKYKYLDKDKTSPYYEYYQKLKKVKEDFPKGEKAVQPEFMLTEKIAMKKLKLMRDDVTFAYKPSNGLGLDYILKNAIRKRVSTEIAALVVYKNLIPVLPRITRGGYDETGLYGFKKKRIDHLVSLFLLIPKK